MKKMLTGLMAVLLLAALSSTAYAQNAQITGTVKDGSGAVIPGTTVTSRNVETGLTRTALTDEQGSYRLPSLPPGHYAVSAELPGFATETRPDIVLVIEQTAPIHFVLKPAGITESVEVTGESPIVDTTQSDVATAISSIQIQDLPVASRRWIDLAMLTPGTSQDNIRGFFYRGNVNIGAGTREYSNGFIIDGVNNTWAEMGEPRQNFAMDAIEEFKVSTSTYKAEYGLATGGVVAVVTKSGTNQIHGSGLLFFRDASITAKEYFQTTKPDYRRYQYGGTVGGPIVKNRTHFFFAYEGTQENQFFTVNAGGLWPQYEGTFKSAQTRWTYNTKIDHQLTKRQSVFFRYGSEDEYRPVITTGGRTTPSASFDFAVPRRSAVVAHTFIINERALNDFRFQYAYAKYEVSPPYSHGDYAPGDFAARLPYCTPVFNYPSIQVGGCGNAQMGPEGRWEVKDDYSYAMRGLGGTHQWKTGFDFSYVPFEGDNTNSPLGSWTFPKDALYDANDRTTWPTQYTNSLPTYANIPVRIFAGYVQDDWHPVQSLTLNLGLRYDVELGSFNENIPELLAKIQSKLGRDGSFPFDVSVFPQPRPNRGDHNNFGPHAGFAWDPRNDGSMNVHAAYGLFYDNMRTLQNFNELTWPQAKAITILNPSFPDPFGGKSRDAFLSSTPPTITVGSNAQINPYAHQFNAGINRMLTRDLSIAGDFTAVARYGDRDTPEINLPDEVTRLRPYPQFNRVVWWQPSANNYYKALLLKVEKRMSNRYQFLTSYTFSHAEDYNVIGTRQDVYAYSKVRRDGVADRRHRLVVSGIIALPASMQVSMIGDFRSSLPFTPTSSAGDLNGSTLTGQLPAGVLPGSGCRSLNLTAINTFRTGRNLAPVTQVDCPRFANIDLRFSKVFRIRDFARTEFIAQLFNIADHANFATPGTNIVAGNAATGRPLFGTSTSLLANINAPSRQAEFAVRFNF
jgi:hypothetical protein